MDPSPDKPLIIQSDKTLLLDVHSPEAEEARRDIGPFTELEKSPEHFHTYRISPLSLWNAAASGMNSRAVADALTRHSRFPVPSHLTQNIRDTMDRYGLIKLRPCADENWLLLLTDKALVYAELSAQKQLKNYLFPLLAEDGDRNAEHLKGFRIALLNRGTIKQELIRLGWPVEDEVPLRDGEPYQVQLSGDLKVRDYQKNAVESFAGDNRPGLGYGVVVLPCGAGKTIVGLGAMDRLQTSTLILTVNVAAVHQWIREIKDKTLVPPEDVGEYTGDGKSIRPITVATYQILVWRPNKESEFPHFSLLKARRWGLIIYDEVHLLPAPVFRITAEIQAMRRLGLTATLVREDGLESDVFSLVGPKRFDVPWKEMESQGWIATVFCHEIRVDLPEQLAVPYAVAGKREKFRLASENPEKTGIVEYLVKKHRGEPILVIGQYIEQLETLASDLAAPLITGKTPNKDRDALYQSFRDGEIGVLIVSKVANFAIDLPDASIAIQISGSFGSRQEEAQRLGRILRPKDRPSFFYTVISRFTVEEEFSANRQQFLTEQGYRYEIERWDAISREPEKQGAAY